MAATAGADIVMDGLVLYLDANNQKSYPKTGSTWYDLSGYGNNASLQGSSEFAEFNNDGYFHHKPAGAYFGADDGSSAADPSSGAYWEVSHDESINPNNTGDWTICSFYNISGSQSGNGTGWFHKTPDGGGIHMEAIGSNFRANFGNGPTTTWSKINSPVSTLHNSFHYYTFTYSTTGSYGADTGSLNFYIDGEVIEENLPAIPRPDTGAPIWMGRRNGHWRHFMKAKVSSYQYYNRELSQEEILQNYKALKSRFNL